ncbi:MAG TPA: histidine kinase, partial [Ramlibacter sp.]|nr:histidine kinase [Ramlibacter sp.]
MRRAYSVRARLLLGAALMLVAFVAAAGLAVQRAHADSVRTAHFAQLQSTVYLLLAEAELDAAGALVMPAAFPEPRLSVPGSGLYAQIVNTKRGEEWKSASTVGIRPPFQRSSPIGEWRNDTLEGAGGAFLAVT